jgi:protein farnesyltransferase/geranylgeranyltransferase type-1 subunit alpha
MSAWNYLRGVLEHTQTPFATLREFVIPYTRAREPGPADSKADAENPRPGEDAQLPAPPAIEFLAEIYEAEPGTVQRAQEVLHFYESA